MVIDDYTREQTKSILVEKFGADSSSLIDYAFSCNILDVNKCRIALIKRHYYNQLTGDITAGDVKRETAQFFCISEKHVENIIYQDFYKPIVI